MKRTLTIAEARDRLHECIRRVEAGDEVVITRNGKPVARLAANAPGRSPGLARNNDPKEGLYGLVGGFPGSDELAELALQVWRERAEPRFTRKRE